MAYDYTPPPRGHVVISLPLEELERLHLVLRGRDDDPVLVRIREKLARKIAAEKSRR
jgi:hypothetical protein